MSDESPNPEKRPQPPQLVGHGRPIGCRSLPPRVLALRIAKDPKAPAKVRLSAFDLCRAKGHPPAALVKVLWQMLKSAKTGSDKKAVMYRLEQLGQSATSPQEARGQQAADARRASEPDLLGLGPLLEPPPSVRKNPLLAVPEEAESVWLGHISDSEKKFRSTSPLLAPEGPCEMAATPGIPEQATPAEIPDPPETGGSLKDDLWTASERAALEIANEAAALPEAPEQPDLLGDNIFNQVLGRVPTQSIRQPQTSGACHPGIGRPEQFRKAESSPNPSVLPEPQCPVVWPPRLGLAPMDVRERYGKLLHDAVVGPNKELARNLVFRDARLPNSDYTPQYTALCLSWLLQQPDPEHALRKAHLMVPVSWDEPDLQVEAAGITGFVLHSQMFRPERLGAYRPPAQEVINGYSICFGADRPPAPEPRPRVYHSDWGGANWSGDSRVRQRMRDEAGFFDQKERL